MGTLENYRCIIKKILTEYAQIPYMEIFRFKRFLIAIQTVIC